VVITIHKPVAEQSPSIVNQSLIVKIKERKLQKIVGFSLEVTDHRANGHRLLSEQSPTILNHVVISRKPIAEQSL